MDIGGDRCTCELGSPPRCLLLCAMDVALTAGAFAILASMTGAVRSLRWRAIPSAEAHGRPEHEAEERAAAPLPSFCATS